MYEQFKSEVLAKLAYMSGDDLRRIGEAMDLVSQKYKIEKQETSIAVLGREEFNEIAYCYTTEKTFALSRRQHRIEVSGYHF